MLLLKSGPGLVVRGSFNPVPRAFHTAKMTIVGTVNDRAAFLVHLLEPKQLV